MYVLVVVLNPAQPERFSQLLGGGEFPGLRSSWGRLVHEQVVRGAVSKTTK
jgi:hypothetical protein